MTITLGYDPEFFPLDKTNPHNNISPHTLISGTKETPLLFGGGTIQVDGIAVEFGTQTGLDSIFSLSDTFRTMLSTFQGAYPLVDLLAVSSRPVDPDWLSSLPESVRELGCEPDFSAYTGRRNPRPFSPNLRTGSGHIHVGGELVAPLNRTRRRQLVQCLDATVGVFAKLCDPQKERAKLYGKAGAFRHKSYGIEYRTPSNAIFINRRCLSTALNMTRHVTRYFLDARVQPTHQQTYTSRMFIDGQAEFNPSCFRSVCSRFAIRNPDDLVVIAYQARNTRDRSVLSNWLAS